MTVATREEYAHDVATLMGTLRGKPPAAITKIIDRMAEEAGLMTLEHRAVTMHLLALTVTRLRVEGVWPTDGR